MPRMQIRSDMQGRVETALIRATRDKQRGSQKTNGTEKCRINNGET
jgi:hypothetical protein